MKKTFLIYIFLLAVLFSILFYRQILGLNLLIFEAIAFSIILFIYRKQKKSPLGWFVFFASVISVITYFLYHSVWGLLVHLLFVLMLPVSMAFPSFRSAVNIYMESLINIIGSQIGFFKLLGKKKDEETSFKKLRKTFTWIILPIVVIILFIVLYRIANPIFNQHIIKLGEKIAEWLSFISWGWFWMFIFGIFLCNILFIKFSETGFFQNDFNSKDNIERQKIRKKRSFRLTALLTEYKSGIFLLIALNLLILYLNIIDIIWVWIGFEWNGVYLKQFVHSGTWILVLSILISMAIVIFYFRGNLNFYKNNKKLKLLATIWLIQNAIMVVSVVIRNLWYINYFGLAYKRIAVFFFLAMVLAGLILVIIKIYKIKSLFWLVRVNATVFLVVILVSSFVNWDKFIASYNFSHYERSFVHYNFLAKLGNSALPILKKSIPELEKIHKTQIKNIPFDVEDAKFIDVFEFYDRVNEKCDIFISKYEKRGWLSWNYADYLTYKQLKEAESK